MPETLKLTLTLPALERLLGGDTALEVELRHQIATQFADRHIKPLVNSPFIAEKIGEITRLLRRQVDDTLQSAIGEIKGCYDKKLELKPDVKALLDRAIAEYVNSDIKEFVYEAMRSRTKELLDYCDLEIQRRIDKSVELQVNKGICDRLAAAARITG